MSPEYAVRTFPPHVEVYVTGVARCFECRNKLAYWEDEEELQTWADEHTHAEEN